MENWHIIKKLIMSNLCQPCFHIGFFQNSELMFIIPLGKKDCQTCKIMETACDSTVESSDEELACSCACYS